MKPVICSGRGWWWWGDQMTNYILLWSLKKCTLESSAGQSRAESWQKACDHPAKEFSKQTQLLFKLPFLTQQEVHKCACVRVHVLDGEYKCDFFFKLFYLIYCLYPSSNFVPLIRLSKGLRLGPYPSWHRTRGRLHPGQVCIFCLYFSILLI